HDGVIEVAVLEQVARFELLRVFPKVFSGTHVNHPRFKVYRGAEGRLEAETSVYADGEDFGTLPIDFRVLPNAIKVWKSL
ncbi:MAG: diacylglycerol kinase, partial [Actinomycetota bacterium]